MGHVTKSVTQRFCGASEACGPAMLVIEVRNRRCVETFYKRQLGPLDWGDHVVRKLCHCSQLYRGIAM